MLLDLRPQNYKQQYSQINDNKVYYDIQKNKKYIHDLELLLFTHQ